MCGIQGDRLKLSDNKVLLHILSEEKISRTLNEFPADSDCHRETKCHQAQVERGKLNPFAVPVQQINQGKANRRAEKPVNRVQHGVPPRKIDVEIIHLSQNFRRKNEKIDDSLKQRGNFYFQIVLHKTRRKKKEQRQEAYPYSLIIPHKDLPDHTEKNQRAQNRI